MSNGSVEAGKAAKNMARNSDEQKFKGILRSVRYRKKCYIQEMARALTLRYGVEDLKEWVNIDNMLDFLAANDSDIEILLKYLHNNPRMSQGYLSLFRGMDLKDPATKAYCINLAVRELVLSALEYGADLNSLEDVENEGEVA